MTGPVTHAVRAMQRAHDPMRGNIEALLRAPVEHHPDQDLIDLGKAFDRAVAERGNAFSVMEEAEARAEKLRPKDPLALQITNFDLMDGFLTDPRQRRRHDVKGWTWTGEAIEEIRKAPPKRGYYFGGGLPPGMRVNDNAERRKSEILAAFDAHQAAIRDVDDACGLIAAEAEYDRLAALDAELAQRIISIKAKTFVGLGVKAHVYAEMWGNPQISEHSNIDHRIIQSVFVDLTELGGRA